MQLAATCAIATLTFDRPYHSRQPRLEHRQCQFFSLLCKFWPLSLSLSFFVSLFSCCEQTGKFCRLKKNSRSKLASVVTELDWICFVFWTFANSMIRTRNIWKFQEPRNCRLGSENAFQPDWTFFTGFVERKNAGISRIKTFEGSNGWNIRSLKRQKCGDFGS